MNHRKHGKCKDCKHVYAYGCNTERVTTAIFEVDATWKVGGLGWGGMGHIDVRLHLLPEVDATWKVGWADVDNYLY